ncbi:hypothetical protein GCM10010256_73480 [Streptomyces coeruleorubidus]|nr:hypothetical protein GCM10010256_73480 [Streptomyces coeruleorubidus]
MDGGRGGGAVLQAAGGFLSRGVRSWRKYKVRVTTEAVIGAVTGPRTAPRTLLLGRYGPAGRLQYVGRGTAPGALHRHRPGGSWCW